MRLHPLVRYGMTAPALALAALLQPAGAAVVPVLPDFANTTFLAGAPITNAYLPLGPSTDLALEASGFDANGDPVFERGELHFGGTGPVIEGVQTTTLIDRAFESGVLVEETFDFYAQDTLGNVWYLGEDVTNFRYDDAGNLIGTDSASSWRAGVNDALPGFAMPAGPIPGFANYQEFAEADGALDEGLILGFLDTLDLGTISFQDVLMVFETSILDPNLREVKYYAPGVGLVRADEGVDANYANPSLRFNFVAPVPVPASLPLLIAGLGVLGAFTRRKGWARS